MSLLAPAAVIRAVTGFRPEDASDDASLVGQAVLGDLATFIERVSEGLDLRADDRRGGAMPLDDAAQWLGVSERSLLRYRSLGLAVHWIDFGTGDRRVGCYLEVLERFRDRRLGAAPRRARAATLTPAQRQAVVESARALPSDPPLPMARVASIVAAAHAIEPARVRRLLARSGLRFAARVRRGGGEVRLAYRAWRRNADPRAIAAHLGRDKAATWRAINAGRRAALRALSLPRVDPLPTFEHPEAAEVLLGPDAVRRGLRVRALPADGAALLKEFAPVALPSRAGEVDACRRLVAMRFLLWRARLGISLLRTAPTSHALDRIETDLRNAASLRRSLVAQALPAALGRLEASIGGALEALPPSRLAPALTRAVAITVASLDAADALDAAEGRLRTARHAALHMDRDLSLHPVESVDRRASRGPSAPPQAMAWPDLEAIIAPWSIAAPSFIECASAGAMPARATGAGELLARRYGWNGEPALTVMELAKREGVAPSLLQRRLLDAWA